jgi:SIR2-like protein
VDPGELDLHLRVIGRPLRTGAVVPLLGAGANLCDRSGPFAPGGPNLPSGAELARYLMDTYDIADCAPELVHVAQYIAVMLGSDTLYQELHRLFEVDVRPNRLHRFLASLPELVQPPPRELQLIVTTNYDDALETAFAEAGKPFDLVSYIADEGELCGKFRHRTPNGNVTVIHTPNEYIGLSGERTVILKLHGAVDREHPEDDSFVITEDDYIKFMARTDASALLPPSIVEKLRRSHILFLGYSLRDWNLRAMFHRLWHERARRKKSWSIQRAPDVVDRYFWKDKDVDILDVGLHEYVDALERHLRGFDGEVAA